MLPYFPWINENKKDIKKQNDSFLPLYEEVPNFVPVTQQNEQKEKEHKQDSVIIIEVF